MYLYVRGINFGSSGIFPLDFGNVVDQFMVSLLDSGIREEVYIACGVLINFMVDEEKRSVLKKDGGIAK
jgi:hypothetical protein